MPFLPHSQGFQSVADVFMRDPKRYHPFAQFIAGVMSGDSDLSRVERETIALYVSELNDCRYCVSAHQAVLRGLGADEAAVSSARAAPRMRPVLELAHKLTQTPGAVDQSDIDAVQAAGWSEQAVEDVTIVVSLFAFMNRLVDGFGIEGSAKVFEKSGPMIAQHGYGPLAQALGQKTGAA